MNRSNPPSVVVGRPSSGGDFQQQGSVDWTVLAGSTVQFSVDILSRMSNAGIEGLTIAVAQTMLSQMKLGDIGETRIHDAVSQLSAFSSLNSSLWFGFGIKHILRRLAETSEGLACIALCAALSEAYSTIDSAKILRELFNRHRPPSELMPALRQWVSLVEVCEGVLAATPFGVSVHEITRICLQTDRPTLRSRADPHAVAEALSGLIQVSNGSLEGIQFLGGADCGWLAAVAHWILDIPVEIRSLSGDVLYRPDTTSRREQTESRVVVVYGDSSAQSFQVVGKCFIVPSGREILHFYEGVGDGEALSCGRLPWSSALRDTFGKPILQLLSGGSATLCGRAIGCAARIFAGIAMSDESLPEDAFRKYRRRWQFVNTSSYGRGFLHTACRWLPEIAGAQRVLDAMEYGLAQDYAAAVGAYEGAIQSIAALCGCEQCTRADEFDIEESDPYSGVFCQVLLVEALCVLVQNLSTFILAVEILPTRMGLQQLYWDRMTVRSNTHVHGNWLYEALLPVEDTTLLQRAQSLFSGRRGTGAKDQSASVMNGICVYSDTLCRISDDPDVVIQLHIRPGRIECNQGLYNEVSDVPEQLFRDEIGYSAKSVSPASHLRHLQDTSSPDLKSALIVQESIRPGAVKSLNASYRISNGVGHFHIGPSFITQQVMRASSGADCRGRVCPKRSGFVWQVIDGEGSVSNLGIPPGGTLLRVLTQSVLARWVALSQKSVFERTDLSCVPAPSREMDIVLQANQCLGCCLTEVLSGKRAVHVRDPGTESGWGQWPLSDADTVSHVKSRPVVVDSFDSSPILCCWKVR